MVGGGRAIPRCLICGLTPRLSVWAFDRVSGYLSLFLVLVAIPVVVTMREMTKHDDQRLRQVLMRARMRLRHRVSRRTWGAISYGPLTFTRRRV